MRANEHMKVGNNYYETVRTFNDNLVTIQNSIQNEINCGIKAGNSCYYPVQKRLSSGTKNLKIKIYKTIILPVVLYGCETRSLTLRAS